MKPKTARRFLNRNRQKLAIRRLDKRKGKLEREAVAAMKILKKQHKHTH